MAAGDTATVKKNLVVLLAIAFVIAVAATGVFYGLFSDKLRDNSAEVPKQTVMVAARPIERGAVLKPGDVQPVTLQGTALKGAVASADQAIGKTALASLSQGAPVLDSLLGKPGEVEASVDDVPQRMRALTIHVVESGGVLALLRPGSRVDVQATVDRGGVPELRCVLQDVEVLSTGSTEASGRPGRPALPEITVLVRPDQADLLALADTASRVRLVLRNREDHTGTSTQRLDLVSLFQGPLPSAPSAAPVLQHASTPVASRASEETVHVRILAAAPATMKQLGIDPSPRTLRVVAIANDAAEGMDLSVSDVSVAGNDTAVVRAGNADCGLRIRLRLRQQLEISPELVWRDGGITREASLNASVDTDASHAFAIAGFDAALSGALARTFPGRNLDGRELLVTIAPRHAGMKQQAMLRP
jgi:Flp pilus assembly protein CpaB